MGPMAYLLSTDPKGGLLGDPMGCYLVILPEVLQRTLE